MNKKTHYSMLLRTISAMLSIVLLLSLTGCLASQSAPSVPASITELKEKLEGIEPSFSGTEKVNLYFDNTKSMHGFVCAGSGKSSTFSIVLEETINMMEAYENSNIKVLKLNKTSNLLYWDNNDKKIITPVEFKNGFRQKDFYTYYGEFDNSNGDYGPLQMLFKDDSIVNFDELNIFITDLAEQELNNAELAKKINDIVQSREDQSVALYRISSNFSGYVAVPIPMDTNSGGMMRMLDNSNFNSKRSFYCLIIGPTIEVVGLCKDMDNCLESLGLIKGSDYDYLSVLSHRGLTYSSIENAEAKAFDNLYLSGDKFDIYQSDYGITKDISNLNYNMELLDHSDLIFDSTGEKLPGLYYKYNTAKGEGYEDVYDFANISFMLPLSDLSNGQTANSNEIEYEIDMESFSVKGAKLNDNSEYQWEEISESKLLESSSPYMEIPLYKVYKKGSTICLTDDKNAKDCIFEEHSEKDMNVYTVDNESGALLVKLSFNKMQDLKKEYDYIVIEFDITGLRNVSGNAMPTWISKYSLPLSSVPADYGKPDKNPEFFTKTIGLENFYNLLVGEVTPSIKISYEKTMKAVISDVLITVDLRETD